MLNHPLVGKTHTFEDGDRIEVIQVKERNNNELFVTFHAYQGPGIPRKTVMFINEFYEHYGHLFDIEPE